MSRLCGRHSAQVTHADLHLADLEHHSLRALATTTVRLVSLGVGQTAPRSTINLRQLFRSVERAAFLASTPALTYPGAMAQRGTTKKQRKRRHHFLPRFLLRGFGSRAKGGPELVWLFRRGAPPVEASVSDVGVTTYFHGRPGEPDVEDKLARDETSFAALVNELRVGRLPPQHGDLIAPFVAHLVLRTRHMRAAVTEFGELATDVLTRQVTHPNHMRATLPSVLTSMDPETRARYERLPRAARRKLIAEVRGELVPRFREAMQQMAGRMGEQVRGKQLDVLGGDLIGQQRARGLDSLSWAVVQVQPGSFILGDLGPVGHFEGSANFDAPLKFGVPDDIFLPVSDSCLLVGWREDFQPEVNVEELNRASAELSRDFFVASRCTERESEYVKLLARRSMYMTIEEMRRHARRR